MINRPPLLSIITVTYNSAHLLEGTIRSVLEQTYPHIEYIIVDGASTDHTDLIIRQAERSNARLLNTKMFQWKSEPDNGLYDAMNKGLQMARGDFVWFVNAGDRLFNRDTAEKMMLQYTPETDVFFGEVMLTTFTRYHLGTRSQLTAQQLPARLTPGSLKMGMVVSHQGFVPRRSLAPSYRTDNLAADIDWVIEILKKSRLNRHTHMVLAEYLIGGLSKQKHQQSLRDRYEILKKHYGFWPNLWSHARIYWRAFWGDFRY